MSGPHPDPLTDMLSKPHELDVRRRKCTSMAMHHPSDTEAWIADLAKDMAREQGADTTIRALVAIIVSLRPLCQRPSNLMERITHEVAEEYGTTPEILRSRKHPRLYALPRGKAYALCHGLREPFGDAYSTVRIGEFFGGRHHTTILSGEMAYRAWLGSRP